MKDNKFAYFLNAVHYCIWLWDIKFQDMINGIVYAVISFISRYMFLGKWGERFNESQAQRKMEFEKIRYDMKNGIHIASAHHWFGYLYSCYPGFLSFVMFGYFFRCYGFINTGIKIFIIALPIGLFYIPVYQLVFSNDCYLRYFKKFEEEDEVWHSKWKRITMLFCVGGILITLLGMGISWAILVR